MTASAQLTVLFDNRPGLPGLRSLWGFAALIRTPDRTVLFDTGSNGRVLLRNMAALGQNPTAIDLLFLSHPHWDHMGGLDSILELNPDLTLVVHEGFSKHLIGDLRDQCGRIEVVGTEPRSLAPGLWSSGLVASEPPEHALVLDCGGATAAICGCAHPGIETLVERAGQVLGRPVDWAVGGLHLFDADEARILRSIETLKALGVRSVLPTHCTGDKAIAAFREPYGARCAEGGVGREATLR